MLCNIGHCKILSNLISWLGSDFYISAFCFKLIELLCAYCTNRMSILVTCYALFPKIMNPNGRKTCLKINDMFSTSSVFIIKKDIAY